MIMHSDFVPPHSLPRLRDFLSWLRVVRFNGRDPGTLHQVALHVNLMDQRFFGNNLGIYHHVICEETSFSSICGIAESAVKPGTFQDVTSFLTCGILLKTLNLGFINYP